MTEKHKSKTELNNKILDKNKRVIYCVEKGCKEKAFEFCRCLEHSKNYMIDDLPTHNDWRLT